MLAMTTLISTEHSEKDDDLEVSSAVSNIETNTGGEEENSDNSGGSLSIGNNSFGFNFDSDEVNKIGNVAVISSSSLTSGAKHRILATSHGGKSVITVDDGQKKTAGRSLGSFPLTRDPMLPSGGTYRHEASAVSSLTSELGSISESAKLAPVAKTSDMDITVPLSRWAGTSSTVQKRPMEDQVDNHTKCFRRENFDSRSSQLNSDNAECKAAEEGYLHSNDGVGQVPRIPSSASCTVGSNNKRDHKSIPLSKRKERNAREKDRSSRISQQIDELRMVLSSGGVVVPKGTKSHVLTEAAKYIQMLQEKQSGAEIERHQLIQQLRSIGNGALGPDAAQAIRQAALQNGVFLLGQFDQLPASSCVEPKHISPPPAISSSAPQELHKATSIKDEDYRQLFELASIPLAIASMGGVFTDCNRMFSIFSEYDKKDLCSMTIFNLIARSDLQNAFNQMSSMVSPQENLKSQKHGNYSHILLRGTMKNSREMGISITLIRGSSRIPKCFLIALQKESYHGAIDQPSLFSTFDCAQ